MRASIIYTLQLLKYVRIKYRKDRLKIMPDKTPEVAMLADVIETHSGLSNVKRLMQTKRIFLVWRRLYVE